MNHPCRGVWAEPCGKTTTCVAIPAPNCFGESRFIDRLHALTLAAILITLPLLAFGQGDAQHAIGLRVTADAGVGRVNSLSFEPNLDLSYRMPLKGPWALEFTAGYGRHESLSRSVGTPNGLFTPVRAQRLQGAVTLQREWRQRASDWVFYAGGGLGFLDYSERGTEGALDGKLLGSVTNVTWQGVVGWRYQFQRVPVELDLGFRPQYGGRGFGLELRPSVGMRYRFGGR